jgi:hypothetical protein
MVDIVKESIALELNVSEIYLLFHHLFPGDEEFWMRLVIEERNHAELLRFGLNYYEPKGRFPEELLCSKLSLLQAVNKDLSRMIENYQSSPPSRIVAFNTALYLERSAGELHYQEFMTREAATVSEEVFMELNSADMDHEKRIRSYMEQNSIPVRSDAVLN